MLFLFPVGHLCHFFGSSGGAKGFSLSSFKAGMERAFPTQSRTLGATAVSCSFNFHLQLHHATPLSHTRSRSESQYCDFWWRPIKITAGQRTQRAGSRTEPIRAECPCSLILIAYERSRPTLILDPAVILCLSAFPHSARNQKVSRQSEEQQVAARTQAGHRSFGRPSCHVCGPPR